MERVAALGKPRHQLVHADHQNTAAPALALLRLVCTFTTRLSNYRCVICCPEALRIAMSRSRLLTSARPTAAKIVLRLEAGFVAQLVEIQRGLTVPLQVLFDNCSAVRQRLLQFKRIEPLAYLCHVHDDFGCNRCRD